MRTQVLETVAGVSPASQEAHSRNRDRRRANRRDGYVGSVNPSERHLELRFDRRLFPSIAARENEHGHVCGVDVRHDLRGKHAETAHRADRGRRQAHGFDAIVAMPPQFRDGVRRFPVREPLDDEQINGLVRHLNTF